LWWYVGSVDHGPQASGTEACARAVRVSNQCRSRQYWQLRAPAWRTAGVINHATGKRRAATRTGAHLFRLACMVGIVLHRELAHRAPDQVHLPAKIAARFTDQQMQAHACALNQSQWPIELFRGQTMYFPASRLEPH